MAFDAFMQIDKSLQGFRSERGIHRFTAHDWIQLSELFCVSQPPRGFAQ